jgi:hypothetical protein
MLRFSLGANHWRDDSNMTCKLQVNFANTSAPAGMLVCLVDTSLAGVIAASGGKNWQRSYPLLGRGVDCVA